MPPHNPVTPRPKLFVGSTTTAREVAEILRAGLDDVADITTWYEGLSTPSPNASDGLVDTARAFDAAAFALCGEPEGGVLLRLGVFLGALGRERIIVVSPVSRTIDLPSDLSGLTVATDSAAIREHLLRLTTPAHPVSQVARRRRRSLGIACSVLPGQTLRIVDISLTGAFLETFGEIPEQQLLDLDLALENGRRIRLTAKVVRIQHPQWGRVGGVGVTFTRFEGDSYAILERYLEFDRGTPAG